MFLSWKKWLHLFPYRREERSKIGQLAGVSRQEGKWQGRHPGRGEAWQARRLGLEGHHLGLLSIISFDTDLDTPNADLKHTAGGRVKVHGEPAGGGNLSERQAMGEAHVTALSPDPSVLPSSVGWLRIHTPRKKQKYLLHSGTEDIIALVIRNLDGAQELHPELVSPVAVFGKSWKVNMQ